MKRRETNQRRLVLRVVQGRCDHPTADSIYEAVHAEDSKVSRGPVYRNLGLLSDGGDVYHIRAPGADRYDLRTDPHDHILCIHCKKVVDAPDTERPARDAEVAAAICEKLGYDLEIVDMDFSAIVPAVTTGKADFGMAGMTVTEEDIQEQLGDSYEPLKELAGSTLEKYRLKIK